MPAVPGPPAPPSPAAAPLLTPVAGRAPRSRRHSVGIWWLALTALAIAVVAPLPYLTETLDRLANEDADLAANYADRPAWVQAFFYTHIVAAGIALFLSPLQLSGRIRRRAPRLHRATGRVVIVGIFIGGAAGLVLSPMNVADEIGFAGFGALALLWLTFAAAGLRAILHGDVAAHRRWMLRAFAMTYAAVTLRLWLLILVPAIGDFRDAYVFVPFLCWVPNLIVVELVLRRSGTARAQLRPQSG
ncbi:DUF2306 domain-containing protein [Yinghuangia soli]|uniref:DUF2306 domain-containing protein n=1 Tax=Yinghuangia soli TaxID=2908204 RepID=A0AA41PW89_9ACTN|nr:DUF2306 domain-containing protein [Yinghuangia soli]MCF2527029.1 DUF2306 domain-containing protein [Yinghuangia soli]